MILKNFRRQGKISYILLYNLWVVGQNVFSKVFSEKNKWCAKKIKIQHMGFPKFRLTIKVATDL